MWCLSVRSARSASHGGRRPVVGELSIDPRYGDRPARQAHLKSVPRPRQTRCARPGHLGADERHRCRSRSPHRRRGRHVHLRGPGGRDAAVRPFTAGGAAAEDHHPRRRGHRPGDRVGVVSQRSAARVGAGDGYPHRRWRIDHRIRRPARRPVPRLSRIPMGRWDIQPGFGSSWNPSRRSWRCGTCGSTRCPTWSPRWNASSTPADTTAPRWTISTAWCSAPTRAICASAVRTATPGPVSDYTGQEDLLPVDSARLCRWGSAKDDRLTIHDYLWRWDTDWFWCSRAFGAQNPRLRRWWPRRYRRSSVYSKLVATGPAFRHRRPHREAHTVVPPRERVVQDVEVPVERTGEFLEWFLDNVPISQSGCARCGFAITTAGRCIRCGRITPTSTSGSGPRCRPAPPRARRIG